MLSFDLILVFLVILFILISLYKELLGTAFTFVVAVVALGFFGILTPKEILSGFANEQIAVIILLLLLGDIIRQTGVIEILFDRIFRSAKSYRGFLSRMMLIIAGFSAFLNNTPLVAVMMPYVNNWCRKKGISPSKFLLPLSYAAILGGCATLIGTSTNLIVSGMVIDQKIVSDLAPLNIFDFAWVGVPMIVIGFFYLLFFGEKLLPKRTDLISEYSKFSREYIVEAQIRQYSKLIGKTIEEASLRNLKGLFLVEIIRKSYKISAVSPDVILQKDDILIFAGDTETIADMIKSDSGLTLPSVGMMSKKRKTEVVEIVISHNSSIIGKTVKEIRFRAKYDAAVIAVHRNGEKISGKIGGIEVHAGDVILLFSGADFVSRSNHTQDFYFISKVKDFNKLETYKTITLLGGTIATIALAAFKIVPLFLSLIVLILVLLAMKIANPKELHKAVDYNLGLIIALSLALGTAMIKTGAAELIANILISVFLPFGKIGFLIGIYLITSILAAYITNKAAVAIIFPISLTMASNLGYDPIPFVLVVSFAAAANFMTPIGYQTNLMVYGPGGYSFKDFFRVGFPLTVLYMIVTVSILSYMYLI
ncbi:MAG: SLC13 family permease [Bacteroidales bacterium]|jgi:di/tricarboxylate transporter|nr:SLC13 family permease [Bacteroidales bacterium]